MRILRCSIEHQFAKRILADNPAQIECNRQVRPEGAYIETRVSVRSEEEGGTVLYTAVATDADLEQIRAERSLYPKARRKPAPAADLDDAIAERVKKLDAASKRRDAQRRGDTAPN